MKYAIFTHTELSEIFNISWSSDVFDICIDSRHAKLGDLFIALEGEHVDGHSFVDKALNAGCVGAIVQSNKNIDNSLSHRLIYVDNTMSALSSLALYSSLRSKSYKIGITGSVGKTTTKDMLSYILAQFKKTYSSIGNFNSKIGLPISLAKLHKDTDFAVLELGMSNFGDIKHLTNLLLPQMAIISHISESHMQFFESLYKIATAKSEIFQTTTPCEVAIIPSDSAFSDFLYRIAKNNNIKTILRFGNGKISDASMKSFNLESGNIYVKANIGTQVVEYKLNTTNLVWINISLSVLLAIHYLGFDIISASNMLSNFYPIDRRGNVIVLPNSKIKIIDDSYNGSYSSTKAAIQALSYLSGSRKVLCLGNLNELGADSIFLHESLVAIIDKFKIDYVFACGDLTKYMFDKLDSSKCGEWRPDSDLLSQSVISNIRNCDTILVKGSNSMQMNKITNSIVKEFN